MPLLQAYPCRATSASLAAVIERAAILGNGRHLEISLALGGTPAAVSGPMRVLTSPGGSTSDLRPSHLAATTTLKEANRRAIELALAEALGRIEGPFGAAKRLGVNPRMRALGIDWKRFRI